ARDRVAGMTGASDRNATGGRTEVRDTGAHVRTDLRDAAVLLRTELGARARRLLGDTRRLVATAFVLLAFGVGLPLFVAGPTVDYGSTLASAGVPAGPTGAVFATVAGVGVYLGAASGFNQSRLGTVGPLVRTSIPPTAVALGRFASEVTLATAFVVPTALVLLAEVGVGAGGPVAPLALVAAALPVCLASLFAGRVVGDLLRYANRYVGLSLWTKALLFLAVTTGVYAATQVTIQSRMGDAESLQGFSVPAFLPGAPLQAYAAVALDPLGPGRGALGGLVALGLLGAIPACLSVALRLETGLLSSGTGSDDSGAVGSRGVPRPFTATPSARVAWRYLLRARRDPRTLAHLGPLLFGAMGVGASVFTEPGSALALAPGASVVVGAALAGATFCLNPLGDDSDQLPLLLTSARSVSVLLRGRALAGVVPGLVLAVGVGSPLAVVEHGAPAAAAQAVVSLPLTAAGAGTALGIGALVPKFERREYMNVERAHPSTMAVLGFLFGSMAVGAAGVILAYWTVGGAPLGPAALAWGVYLAVLAVPGGAGYVYAVRKFDALSLDDV
ncbi:MAG: hypothetical protein ABEJ40_00470, partial [Haloarculaceae archaeon]